MTDSTPPAATLWFALLACAVAVVGVAAVWAGMSLVTRSLCGWMAVIAALDAALLLRLANWPGGRGRALAALAVVVLTVLVAAYFVATAQIGRTLGLRPFEALPRMSLELAALYLRSNAGWVEALWSLSATAVAWRAAR